MNADCHSRSNRGPQKVFFKVNKNQADVTQQYMIKKNRQLGFYPVERESSSE